MNKKILNTSLTIIVILIVIIFSSIYYYVTKTKATSSIYEEVEVVATAISENKTEYDTSKLNPFTGAFPGKAVIPFLAESGNINEFSNEQILQLGFAKANKEDWADSYIGEGEPVSISAELVDRYIKDIFGEDVKYNKENFSNKKYGIDKTINSFFYDAIYVPENDTYTIDFIAGDGIGENHIDLLEPIVSKISDNLEIEIPYVFVGYNEEMISKQIDGESIQGFEYIVYLKCDYNTKELSDEIGRFTEFDVNDSGEFIYSDHIDTIVYKNFSKLQKIRLIYGINEAGTEYVLKEIRK